VISWVGDNLIAHWALEDDNDTTPPYTAGPDSALTWNQVSKNSTFTINESPEHGKHLWIRFSLDTGGDFANLDKVQVEEGTVPTPFEHRLYGVELALCQRYYQIDEEIAIRVNNTITPSRHPVYLKVSMRVSPTVVLSGSGLTNVTLYGTPTENHFNINDNTQLVDIYVSYTADAEL
jgi:hypothetical protein